MRLNPGGSVLVCTHTNQYFFIKGLHGTTFSCFIQCVYTFQKVSANFTIIRSITTKGHGKKNQEFIGVYDQNGKPYWVGMGPKGMGLANFPDLPAGCTLIQNHPGGAPFSMQDFKEFIRFEMKKMVVTVQLADGKIGKYTLTKKIQVIY